MRQKKAFICAFAVTVVLLMVLSGLPLTISERADPNLVAEWHLDEGSGPIAYDSSMNNNHGALKPSYPSNAPKWVNGKFGKALEFDGRDDYVNVPYDNTLNIKDKLTLGLWVNPVPSNNYQVMVVKGSFVWDWGLYVASNNRFMFGHHNLHEVYSSTTAVSGIWYHVVGVYENSNWRIYINGNLENTKLGASKIGVSSNGLAIGRKGDNSRDYFKGIIDEVAIFDRALSAKEVEELFESYLGISADVSVEPQSLNLDSMGNFVQVKVEGFPDNPEYTPMDVDGTSVEVAGVSVDLKYGTWNNNRFIGKADRLLVEDAIGAPGQEVEVDISGNLNDGTPFMGQATIKAI